MHAYFLAQMATVADWWSLIQLLLGIIYAYFALQAIGTLVASVKRGLHTGEWKDGFLQACTIIAAPPLVWMLMTRIVPQVPAFKVLFA